MSSLPFDGSDDEARAPEAHGDLGVPLRGTDPDLLDEDPLLEEQPYVGLEEDVDGSANLDVPNGSGSW